MTNAQYFPHATYLLATDREANEEMIDEILHSWEDKSNALPEAEDEVMDLDELMEAQTEEQRAVEKAKIQAYKDRVSDNLQKCLG